MSERWIDSFSFQGRLSRPGAARIERRVMLLMTLGVVLSLLLLISSVPRALAVLPGVLIPIGAVVLMAAYFRRMHDVGMHASGQIFRETLGLIVIAGPAVGALVLSELPVWLAQTLLAASGVMLLFASIRRYLRGLPEWRPGDERPNAFGPPPER